ncbi:helicase-like protein [Promicromonospora sp. AC04]|uniref:DEAD/DEAH box helicase n=1 Tax=Promicromonospora sp. AC04 TaxID=2135723 RepID=UPI000D3DA5AB|nr:DEAD/DEAH box helicase [Promicromonospora sp. AC04]PUB32517.1 helicase-like protein [Promicromonospora sp. AC04]
MTTNPAPAVSLKPHQRQIHDFLISRPFAGAWLGVGAGKTLTTLAVLQTLRPLGHILVVAPVGIARSTWIDEIEKWNFPIRTKSLIVDDNDKKLSRAKRLERFREVFTDPPTMYFVNQELLTQPSHPTRLLSTVSGATPGPDVSTDVICLLDLLRSREPLSQDELIAAYRAEATGSGGNVPAKSTVQSWIQELVKAKLIARRTHVCRSCGGDGCAACRFGLVDQMPIQTIDGQDTIIWPFPTVIIDESQGFKSHSSDRFKALAQVRPAVTRLVELTGTPSPNGLHDLWSQVFLLDQGRALGRDIDTFRDRWFVPKMIRGTRTPARWVATEDAEPEIYQAISHLVMSAQNTNLQLPALTIHDVNVTLPPDLLQAYKDFRHNLVLDVVNEAALRKANAAYDHWLNSSPEPEAAAIRAHLSTLAGGQRQAAHDDFRQSKIEDFVTEPDQELVRTVVAENQAVLTSKLMQFASGTLYTADPEAPSTAGRYEVIHDKKLEMVEYLVRNNGGEPVLIAYHFRSDLEQLLARLEKAGIEARAFDGSRNMVRRWNAQQIPVMLLHPASAGHGLNLQDGGATMIWYTLPFSLEHYLQTNGRLHRMGQTRPVTIHRLIAKGTQDERMPQVLAGKQQVQDDLIHAVSGDHALEHALLAVLEEEIHEDLNDLWATQRA